jgi:hypothetical protein
MSSAAKRQIIEALDDLPEQSLATVAELVDLLRAKAVAGPLDPDRVPELGGLSKGHPPAAGSPAAILSAMRRLPQLDPDAVDELERVIDEGRLPVRSEGVFELPKA